MSLDSLEIPPTTPQQETQPEAQHSVSPTKEQDRGVEGNRDQVTGVAKAVSSVSSEGNVFVAPPLLSKSDSTPIVVTGQSESARDAAEPPTLDTYDGPPIGHGSTSEYLDSTAQEDDRWQINSLSVAVINISQFATEMNKERLRFVASCVIVDRKLKKETPHDIYNLFFDKYDSHFPPKEDSPTFAATVFKEALVCANFPHSHTDLLTPFCKEGLEEEESLKEQLNFRKKLLVFGDMIPNPKAVQKLARQFSRRELGKAREDIKTPIQLFQGLLISGTISPERGLESIQMLENKWKKVDDSLRQSANIQDSGLRTSQPVERAPLLPNDPRAPRRGSVEEEQPRRDEPAQQTGLTCSTKICLAAVLTTLCVGILTGIGLGIPYGLRSTLSHPQNITVISNNTIFVGEKPLDAFFTASIQFFLTVLPANPFQTKALVCHVDCPSGVPPTRFISLSINDTSTPNPPYPSTKLRRHISFLKTTNFAYTNIYLSSGSYILFSTSPIGAPIQLHVFNNVSKCQLFLRSSTNSSYQSLKLDKDNGYTANFTVLPEDQDSYYCFVWELPSDHANVTFQFSLGGAQTVYDTDSDGTHCTDPLEEGESVLCPDGSDTCYLYNFYFNLSLTFRPVCVFLVQTNQVSEVTAAMRTFSTYKNLLFGFPMGVLLFCFVLLIIVVVILICCIRKKCRPSCFVG